MKKFSNGHQSAAYNRFGKRTSQSSCSNAPYERLCDQFTDSQFRAPVQAMPWKAICLALVLFVFGSILIIIGAMLLSGFINAKYADRTWPLLVLGTIMFIPGFYHLRIAYYAYRGYKGYSYDDIPDFD